MLLLISLLLCLLSPIKSTQCCIAKCFCTKTHDTVVGNSSNATAATFGTGRLERQTGVQNFTSSVLEVPTASQDKQQHKSGEHFYFGKCITHILWHVLTFQSIFPGGSCRGTSCAKQPHHAACQQLTFQALEAVSAKQGTALTHPQGCLCLKPQAGAGQQG